MRPNPALGVAYGICAILALFIAPVLYAQSADPNETGSDVEEIVVTATRRPALVQDVAGSVGVIAGSQLHASSVDGLDGLSGLVNGLIVNQPLRNRSTLTIRGLNTDVGETQLTQEPVTLYLNDIPATSAYADLVQPDLPLYDIDRIEVLRGPQGTLFGSGSLGGAVRIITREPRFNEWDWSARFDLADTARGGDRQRYDAMMNVPLVENQLALRVVAYAREDDGWVKNTQLNTFNRVSDRGGRVALRWAPAEQFSLNAEYLTQDSEPEAGDSYSAALGQFERQTVISEARPSELDVFNITAAWKIAGLDLVSSTNWKTSETFWTEDLGEIPGVGPLINQTGDYNYDTLVQELRASAQGEQLDWVAGLYYFESDLDTTFSLPVLGLQDLVSAILGPSANTRGELFGGNVAAGIDELALFGDATWRFSPQWSVSTGLRAFRSESRYTESDSVAFDFTSLQDLDLPGFTNEADDSNFTWRLALSHQPRPEVHYYLSAARGYRVGQVNPNSGPSFVDPSDVIIPAAYEPDESLNWELGIKSSWRQGRVSLNTAVFYIDWSNVQMDAARRSDGRNFIANAGDAVSKGLELDFRAQSMAGAALNVGLTLLDAEVRQIDGLDSFVSGATAGDELPGTADFTGYASGQYTWDIGRQRNLVASAGIRYSSDSTNRFSFGTGTGAPNPDLAVNEAYTVINASLSLVTETWTLSLYGDNLTNNDATILNIGATEKNPLVSLRPRTIGVRWLLGI